MTLEFSSIKNQHRASSFLLFALYFFPQSGAIFLFMRPSAVERVLASLHCVGKGSYGVDQKTLDYFFLVVGIEEEHIGPWMVSQLIGVGVLSNRSGIRAH